jgi:hypothetical protein
LFEVAKNRNPLSISVFLRLGELEMQKSEFAEAVKHLKTASRLTYSNPNPNEKLSASLYPNDNPKIAELRKKVAIANNELFATVFALLGVATFRASPAAPEVTIEHFLVCMVL